MKTDLEDEILPFVEKFSDIPLPSTRRGDAIYMQRFELLEMDVRGMEQQSREYAGEPRRFLVRSLISVDTFATV